MKTEPSGAEAEPDKEPEAAESVSVTSAATQLPTGESTGRQLAPTDVRRLFMAQRPSHPIVLSPFTGRVTAWKYYRERNSSFSSPLRCHQDQLHRDTVQDQDRKNQQDLQTQNKKPG